MGLAYGTAIEWSDWVIRLPRGGDSPLGTVILFLVLAMLVYGVVRGTVALGDKLTPIAWSVVSLFGFVLFIMVYNQIRDDETTGTDVQTEVDVTDNAECEDALLSRCPASLDDG